MRGDRVFGAVSTVDGQLAGANLANLPRLPMVVLASVPLWVLCFAALSPNPTTPPIRSQASSTLSPINWRERTPRVGESIGRYVVSSDWGKRTQPCAGCSRFHKGTDVAAPIGSPVYAVGQPGETVTVTCDDAQNLVIQSAPSLQGHSIETLHISKCIPGDHRTGSLIALSGAWGTGPHYHIQVRNDNVYTVNGDGLIPPPRSVVTKVVGR